MRRNLLAPNGLHRYLQSSIARAIVQAAEYEGLTLPTVTQFENLSGMGVRAQVQGHHGGQRIEIGADRFMRQLGLDVTAFAAAAEQLGQEGKPRSTPPSTANWPPCWPWPTR